MGGVAPEWLEGLYLGRSVDIWIPLDSERVGHVPSALAGTTFQIGRFSGEPLLFEDWDGQPFELP